MAEGICSRFNRLGHQGISGAKVVGAQYLARQDSRVLGHVGADILRKAEAADAGTVLRFH